MDGALVVLKLLILLLDVDDTATLFCHGTDKRTNFINMESLGLTQSPLNNNKVELLCNPNKVFEVDGKVISVDRLNDATCTRIMEPLIEVKIKKINLKLFNPPVYLHLIFEISSVIPFFFNFEISTLEN